MEKEKYELFKTDRVEFVAEIYKYENCLNFLIESNGFKAVSYTHLTLPTT